MKLLFHLAYFSFFIQITGSVRLRNENGLRKLQSDEQDGWLYEYEFETGQCEQDNLVPTPGQLKVMVFNMWLITCVLGTDMAPCQSTSEREIRVDEIAKWMKTRDEDVILVQELFSFHDQIRDGMIEASYCHYVATTNGNLGSGLAIYSKYPIEEHEFREWASWTTSGENFLDSKGVLYAKIRKGGEHVHFSNLHTTSTTYSGSQSDREEQFRLTRRMIDGKHINTNELVLVGGDMNTNKYAYGNGEEIYRGMLQLLHADVFDTGGNRYTYDTEANALTASKYDEGVTHQELLDYILYDQYSVNPFDESSCEIIIPIAPGFPDSTGPESMLSDHLPVTCNILYPTANPNPPPSDGPMFFAEVTVQRASVCDADSAGGGYSDPYVDVRIHINDSEHECGKTSTIDETNDPAWDETISCSNVQFQATDRVLISFYAYDDDSFLSGGPDFIGTGVTAVNPNGEDFAGHVPLAYGNCNENGQLYYSVQLNEVQGS